LVDVFAHIRAELALCLRSNLRELQPIRDDHDAMLDSRTMATGLD
jgi:hypothetical protein